MRVLIGGFITCFDSSPVAEGAVVFGLRVLEVHAVDGAAVHGGRALPGRLRPGRVVRDVGTNCHSRRRVCPFCLRGTRERAEMQNQGATFRDRRWVPIHLNFQFAYVGLPVP